MITLILTLFWTAVYLFLVYYYGRPLWLMTLDWREYQRRAVVVGRIFSNMYAALLLATLLALLGLALGLGALVVALAQTLAGQPTAFAGGVNWAELAQVGPLTVLGTMLHGPFLITLRMINQTEAHDVATD